MKSQHTWTATPRKLLPTLAFALMAALGCAAHAEFPERPIRIVNGFSPGGMFDTVARMFAQKITERDPRWTFYIDSRAGADGRIGAAECNRAPADGYTLCISGASSHAIHAGIFKNLPYDVVTGFTPVFFVGSSANIVATNMQSPINSIADLVKYAKSNPKTVSYASAGAGTSTHLAGELLNQAAGIELLHVPYKGGAPAITAAIAGQTTVIVENLSSVAPFVTQGKLKALAVTSEHRQKVLPQVPTVAELGYPGYSVGNWYAFFAPANLPPEISAAIYSKMSAVAALPDVKEVLEKRGVEPILLTQQQFKDFQRAEVNKFKAASQKANIEIQ